MDAENPKVARDLVHGERARGSFRVDQKFAAVGVDEFARHAGRFLRLALGVADDHFNRAAGQSSGGVDLVDLDHDAVARRGSELRDAA